MLSLASGSVFDSADLVAVAASSFDQTSGGAPETPVVCVGDTIATDGQEGFLRGHGTQIVDGELVATVSGAVERINKLVSVRTLKSRYTAELGDVLVGRVREISGKRWKVDINGRQEAVLQLSAVNLPGGIQRRRTAEDELNMRSVFQEGDLISTEVQSFFADGSVALHTRSTKYGKLKGGQLVTVACSLIRRQKQHFIPLESLGVDVILGCNGLVWVTPHVAGAPAAAADQTSEPDTDVEPSVSAKQRAAVCRTANALRALGALGISITPATIEDTCKASIDAGVQLHAMLEGPFLEVIISQETQRRQRQ
ncbi:hypothetical protein WJX72_007172 [[Myrmecia] bisecta]|uniref:Ribosomal RNA-processing protein 4 n=1 Tax=[Myrmecia] bisecta TaxID=41462 RepID=A0AAW1QR90_9CHLO